MKDTHYMPRGPIGAKNHLWRSCACVLILVIHALTGSRNCLGDVVFFDGAFNNSDWSKTIYVNGNGGTSSARKSDSGGNPGSFYEVTTSVNSGPGCGAGVYLRDDFAYSPSIQGAIYSVDYRVDLIALSLYGEAEPVVSQNGKTYFGPEIYTTLGTWQTVTESNLVATNFLELTGNPNGELGGNPFSNPDFSTNGAPITFGFIVPDSTMSTSYTTVGGVDNYTLTVHVAGSLNIDFSDGIAALSWLGATNAFSLESTATLAPPAWSVVADVPSRSGEFNIVTNRCASQMRFFRLRAN